MTSDKIIKLVFATHNPNKLKEIQSMVPPNIKLLSLEDIGCTTDIPETSGTIEGNALQKATFVKENYGYDCFADDTGLEVEALQGRPGVKSARYAGEEKNDEQNIQKLLKELEGKNNRSARFKTVVALFQGEKKELFTGICTGTITTSKSGKSGFGYDPVFKPEGSSATFAEMKIDEKTKISHRGKAMEKLIRFLSK